MATIDLTTDEASRDGLEAMSGDGLEAMSVKALKAEAASRGASIAGCVEKADIIRAIRAAPEATTEAPAKRRRETPAASSPAGSVFVLSFLSGWSSIETSDVVGFYATWAEVQAKAKDIVENGHGGENFWLPEDKGGYRYVEEDDDYDDGSLTDKTNTPEPKGKGSCELASARHCEGEKGNMILVAQRVGGVALA
mmetsp:Transcript_15294/g.47369  ORF Transcript_15294/g.47369 Transcript_15294/m.47369 type:complete len:195 (-) Transcript_15294:412-996(-)